MNADGEAYECARRYMIRLDEDDFADPGQLAHLAAITNIIAEQFRARFGYLAADSG